MTSALEREYYEFDRFWNPEFAPLGERDFQRIADIANLVPADARSILDVGCGNGVFCNYLKQQRVTSRIVGLDRSTAALKYVQTERVLANITELPFEEREFDCVTALEVVEHLPLETFEMAKRELARVAASYIIVSVPNNQTLGENLTQCPACKTRFDPDLHMRSFRAETMNRLFADQGFTSCQVHEVGHYTEYVGFHAVMNALYRQRESKVDAMASPLCPVCGFRNEDFLSDAVTMPPTRPQNHKPGNGFLSQAKGVAKRLWPKVSGNRWLVGLYARES